ncbi:hypothetical protein Goari_016248 [Gossypium aridum]|uniref:Uncharacterized protein n=1 Tax=Gossypium aridum TaxID=34290 RepID=A0A7J8WJ09_GOSAI|nr:hypothetical protein [Gossypium aridum]
MAKEATNHLWWVIIQFTNTQPSPPPPKHSSNWFNPEFTASYGPFYYGATTSGSANNTT